MPIVAGVRLQREKTLELAAMLGRQGSDRPARLLLESITHGQEFVALSFDDRRAVLAVLDRPPAGLIDLRGALFDELNWRCGVRGDAVSSGMSPYSRRSS